MDPASAFASLRRRPEPLVAGVGLGMLVLTFALASWSYALDAAAEPGMWRPDPTDLVEVSAPWAATVALWCAVAWVASRRQSRLGRSWRVPAVACVVMAVWSLVAWRSDFGGGLLPVAAPWPGPAPSHTLTFGAVPPYDPFWALRPGAVMPIVVAAAITWVARVAAGRGARADDRPVPTRIAPSAHGTALVVLGPPAVAATAAAALVLAPFDSHGTTTEIVLAVVVDPGFRIALALVATFLLGGTGRAGWVLTGLVTASTLSPMALAWWGGGPDDQLAACALGAAAIALVAAVHPLATAVSRLIPVDDAHDRVLPGSVPERTDADDRARA